MPSKTSLTGVGGEHYVLSELLRRGYIAALAPTGVPNADIVVTNMEGSRLCSIQVKSRRGVGADGGWHMSKKHEVRLATVISTVSSIFGNRRRSAHWFTSCRPLRSPRC